MAASDETSVTNIGMVGRFPAFGSVNRMEVEQAIRTRRTHKAYAPEPVDRAVLDELFELASWAPNHNLTNPWRFRVVGPEALAKLKQAAGPESAPKLDRAPTLVVASAVQCGHDPVLDEEDHAAAAVATYVVLLGAHARGLAGYWRTPAVLRTPDGRAAVGLDEGERVLGLIHLGHPRQVKDPPPRAPSDEYVTYLP
jgi:nitroreductase